MNIQDLRLGYFSPNTKSCSSVVAICEGVIKGYPFPLEVTWQNDEDEMEEAKIAVTLIKILKGDLPVFLDLSTSRCFEGDCTEPYHLPIKLLRKQRAIPFVDWLKSAGLTPEQKNKAAAALFAFTQSQIHFHTAESEEDAARVREHLQNIT